MARGHVHPIAKTTRRPTFIRQWRRHRGLTLVILAERIGVSHATLSRVERGRQDYNQGLLELLAEELGTDPASLLIRDPTDPEGIWSIWDQAKPGQQRRGAAELLKTYLRNTG